MVAIKNLAFFAASVTALVLPRNAATVLADLKVVNDDTTAVKKNVDSYTGTGAQTIAINNSSNKLNNDIKQTTTDSNASAVASDADAKSIISYINQTLEPNIKATLNSVKAKKATFASSGLKSTVQSQLKTLQSSTSDLSKSLLSRTPTSQKAAASSAAAKVNADLADAVAYYNS